MSLPRPIDHSHSWAKTRALGTGGRRFGLFFFFLKLPTWLWNDGQLPWWDPVRWGCIFEPLVWNYPLSPHPGGRRQVSWSVIRVVVLCFLKVPSKYFGVLLLLLLFLLISLEPSENNHDLVDLWKLNVTCWLLPPRAALLAHFRSSLLFCHHTEVLARMFQGALIVPLLWRL